METSPLKQVPRICGYTPSHAVHDLGLLYLHAGVWGTPQFEQLHGPGDQKDEFRQLVQNEEALGWGKYLRTVCLQHEGVELPDIAISVTAWLAFIVNDDPLPEHRRLQLLEAHRVLHALFVRLEAEEVVLYHDDFEPVATGRWAVKADRASEVEIVPAISGGPSMLPAPALTLPEYMTAKDLAKALELPYEATRKKLQRLADDMDCRREVEGPRVGEPTWMYHVPTVRPELEK